MFLFGLVDLIGVGGERRLEHKFFSTHAKVASRKTVSNTFFELARCFPRSFSQLNQLQSAPLRVGSQSDKKSKVLQAALLIRDPWRPKVCKVPQPFVVRGGLRRWHPLHPSSKRSLSRHLLKLHTKAKTWLSMDCYV
jgi:hypothetical protein